MTMALTLPPPLQKFFSLFPLHTYTPVPAPVRFPLARPTLWIAPPRSSSSLERDPGSHLLSADVECLKWQAYIALRGLTDIAVRWDISPQGGLDGRLPTLHVPAAGDVNHLVAPHNIPAWVDGRVTDPVDELEGYKDDKARDESHAWISLLEGVVHAALVLSQPTPTLFSSLFKPDDKKARSIEASLNPPPAPLTGYSSLFPSFGTNITLSAIQGRYADAISSLSERLGTDRWFLGSKEPTALDALVFAYLHCIFCSQDAIRIEVARRANLVAWERRVRTQVQAAFSAASRQ
ncbi:hypothetical protein F5I97DRAFT_1801463 [Phlebopus sp. FC_14]|nr:hypothetical protein F5I97DRAFT_1801463 [Phlebopus sp. FC_14]